MKRGERQIVVGRYIINPDGASCEFAIVVAEAWQGHGLGRHLMLDFVVNETPHYPSVKEVRLALKLG